MEINGFTQRVALPKVPLCKGNLLDKRQYHYPKETIGSYFDSSQYLMAKSGPCLLLNYTAERIVECLDTIRYQHSSDIQLRFIFMGDSRTRQQFLNFVRVKSRMQIYDIVMKLPFFKLSIGRQYHSKVEGDKLSC